MLQFGNELDHERDDKLKSIKDALENKRKHARKRSNSQPLLRFTKSPADEVKEKPSLILPVISEEKLKQDVPQSASLFRSESSATKKEWTHGKPTHHRIRSKSIGRHNSFLTFKPFVPVSNIEEHEEKNQLGFQC